MNISVAGRALDISASVAPIDGPCGTLASGGPPFVEFSGFTGEFMYADEGELKIDTADIAAFESSGSLLDVVPHETAHVIGFGWSSSEVVLAGYQELYASGTGMYTTSEALAQSNAEFARLHEPRAGMSTVVGAVGFAAQRTLRGRTVVMPSYTNSERRL